jgi:hypothetical protein
MPRSERMRKPAPAVMAAEDSEQMRLIAASRPFSPSAIG